jgi:siroheme synthase
MTHDLATEYVRAEATLRSLAAFVAESELAQELLTLARARASRHVEHVEEQKQRALRDQAQVNETREQTGERGSDVTTRDGREDGVLHRREHLTEQSTLQRLVLGDQSGEQFQSPCACLVHEIARYSAQISALVAGGGRAA